MGWVYNFTMINIKGSPTRWKFAFFYLIVMAENATITAVWYLNPDNGPHWYHLPALVGTGVSFAVGIAFMLLYYRKYHPDGKMPKKSHPANLL